MEKFGKTVAYVVLAVMGMACLLLLLHYAGVIAATSTAWLWAFVWVPPAVVAGALLLAGAWSLIVRIWEWFAYW